MSDWKPVRIEQLCLQINRGASPVYKDGARNKVVNQACIYWDIFKSENRKDVDELWFNSLLKIKKCTKGDILLNSTGTGTLGRACIYPLNEESAFDGHVTLIRTNPAVSDHRFVFYLIQHDPNNQNIQLNCVSGSTNQIELNVSAFRKFVLNVPDKRIQCKVADILEVVDLTISKTTGTITKLEKIKTGLMQDLFTRGIDASGKLRPPASERPDLFKESPLGLVPSDWRVPVLHEQKIAIIDGDRGENYPKNSDLLPSGFCLFLSAENVTKRGFEFVNCQFINRTRDELLRKGKLKRNDIILTTRGTVGNFAHYSDEVPFDEVRINSGMVILRNTDAAIDTQFLYAALRNWIFDIEFRKVVSGSAQPQLPIKDFRKFHLLVPTLNEQRAVLERIDQINKAIETEMAALRKHERQKLGLMQDLLTGRKPVVVTHG